MPGEQNEFDMAGAVNDIGSGLGFSSDTPDEPVDNTGTVDGSVDGVSAPSGVADTATGAEGAVTPSPADTTAPTDTALAAPRTWRPEAAAEWANLPPTVQQEIAKREEDIFKGIEGYKQDATFGRGVQSVIAPYEATLRQYGIDPVQHVGKLMQAHHALALGAPEQKLAFFQQLAQDYGIDLSGAGGQQPYVDPEVQALRAELASVKSVTTTIQQERVSQHKAAIESEVSQFAADPANVYFKDVVNDMAHLIKTNQAASVKDAYEKAMWLNPVIRAKEISRQQAEATTKATKDAEAKALAAKRALGANVRSSAKSGSAAAPLGSMDDTLAETLASIKARS